MVFTTEIRRRHRALRIRLYRYVLRAPVVYWLTAPVIYALIVPFVLLDGTVSFYQVLCFPAWRIPRVKRRRYIVLDRHHLAYLNGLQKLNCLYCGYANGVVSYVREVAARTEQFWCPIKHALRTRGSHRRYRDFLDYGDAEDLHERLKAMRQKLRATK